MDNDPKQLSQGMRPPGYIIIMPYTIILLLRKQSLSCIIHGFPSIRALGADFGRIKYETSDDSAKIRLTLHAEILSELPILDPKSRRIREYNMQKCLHLLVFIITPSGCIIPTSNFIHWRILPPWLMFWVARDGPGLVSITRISHIGRACSIRSAG